MSTQGMAANARWRITVDQQVCMGTAACAGAVPNRFRIVNNKSEPVDAHIEPDEDVLAAADSCPMEAIRIVEVATGEIVAPTE